MGHVDRFDKCVALSRLRLKRCKKRYHRVLGIWNLAGVNNNVIVLFAFICKDAEELRKSKEASDLGYRHWFQNQLGNVVINHGLHRAEEQWLYMSACRVNMFMRRSLLVIRRRRIRRRIRFGEVYTCITLTSIPHTPTCKCVYLLHKYLFSYLMNTYECVSYCTTWTSSPIPERSSVLQCLMRAVSVQAML